MRSNRLIIRINKPASVIFDFLLNPVNTPLWISSIVREEVSESPTKIGTVYRDQDREGKWHDYKVTSFEKNKLFVFTSGDKNYHVRYTFRPIGWNAAEIEYFEWVDKGELDEPFKRTILNRLKTVIEKRYQNQNKK